MPTLSTNTFGGYSTQINSPKIGDWQVVQALNVTHDPLYGYSKRPGYNTFLGTADGSAVNTLFSWWKNDGTTMWLYRASGATLYSSAQGTGAWTQTAGDQSGTISAGAYVGHAVLNNTMIAGDGVGSARTTTDGTTFTSNANAPISKWWLEYQQRVYALGTGSAFSYSTANDATNWSVGGTSDSATFVIGGEGSIGFLYKNSDRVFFDMFGRYEQFQWDGFNMVDLVNDLGPTSPYSFDQSENLAFWLNRLGIYSFSGAAPQIVSNPIQKLIYNNSGSGIAGGAFGTAVGVVHKYDYLCAVGTVTDDFTNVTVSNAILKYDIRHNDWAVWQFNDNPTAFHSYRDTSGVLQLIFGNSSGQVFQLSGTASTDNGTAIQSILEFVIYCGTLRFKNFYALRAAFNPGCEAQIEVAVTNSLTARNKKYTSLGQAIDGVIDTVIPTNQARGKFMFIKISDNSLTSGFILNSIEIDYDVIPTAHAR